MYNQFFNILLVHLYKLSIILTCDSPRQVNDVDIVPQHVGLRRKDGKYSNVMMGVACRILVRRIEKLKILYDARNNTKSEIFYCEIERKFRQKKIDPERSNQVRFVRQIISAIFPSITRESSSLRSGNLERNF